MSLLDKIKTLILNTYDNTVYFKIPIYCKKSKFRNLEKCKYINCNNLTKHYSGYCSNQCCKLDKES